MASSGREGKPNGGATAEEDVDFAQAFKDLAEGEQTASALEKHLDSLESKIEELLAQAERDQREQKQQQQQQTKHSSSSDGGASDPSKISQIREDDVKSRRS